jgi:lysophospholipase L1-like esterase
MDAVMGASPSPGRSGARWLLGILGVVVFATAVGADVATPSATDRNSHVRAVVLFVGDSNISVSVEPVYWALTYGDHNDNAYVPMFTSRPGAAIRTEDCLVAVDCATTDYWKTRLGELLPEVSPDVVVTNLGVNDTAGVGTAETAGSAGYPGKIDWFMELLPEDTPVLWTNLPCDLLEDVRADACALVNDALADAVDRWPNLVVLDWATAAAGHPDYLGDIVHLSEEGQAAWTELVVGALDERFPAP